MRLGPLGLPELLIILAVLLLIFGARRLPEIGSSLGRGIRSFKSSVTGEEDIEQSPAKEKKPVGSGRNTDDLA
ncbi:MAG: twin-arginine translocase TatA/TatE family subunit [Chloroflexi bacterium]|nr:twin-arginine translocase TatA/TatE family subunit [Chloroflexota bacterium]